MNKKYVIIDLCGTLYSSNTTFEFLDYVFAKNLKYHLFKFFFKNILGKSINKIITYFFSTDLLRILAIRFLKGFSREEVEHLVDEYYYNILQYKKQHNVIELVDSLRTKEYELIIVSATLDCITKKVAQELNIYQYYSSELFYDKENRCLGKIKYDLLGKKLDFLLDKGFNPPFEIVISDNISDLKLMQKALLVYVIIPFKLRKNGTIYYYQKVLLILKHIMYN